MRASEIAALVGGVIEGEADPDVTGVAPLDRAASHELSFLASSRYLAYLPRAEAGAILITESLKGEAEFAGPRIIVQDVYRALAALLPRLYPEPEPEPGVHPTAVVEPGARLGRDVAVGPYVVIGSDARVGDRARIGAHAVVGSECEVGDDVVLHPHVTLYPRVRIGPRSILHAGVRVGVDGFGYAREDGRHRKIPQVGRCIIGADVEIGANTTIDRGSVGATEVGDGVKIDNLVHIGHNVRIGDGSIVVAQVGVAGSTHIGRGVTLAGQAGIPGHVSIGDGATVAAQAGVFGDVPAGETYSGYPARPHKESLRAQAALFRLPEALRRIHRLEQRLSSEDDDRE